ncbi:MAG: hypothetical protein V2A34_07120 [Lentisphaerota bacterium]
MSAQLTCQHCGCNNEFSRLHCIKCGERLNFKSIERHHKNIAVSRQAGRFIKSFLRLSIFTVLVAVLGLMLWPLEPAGQKGLESDAAQYASRIFFLEDAMRHHRSATQIFSEAEINAYLEKLILHNQTLVSDGGRFNLSGVNFQLRTAEARMVVTVRQGPVFFSYSFTLVPVIRSGKPGLSVRGAEWGHLPLPAFASHWLMRRVVAMFSGLKTERDILEKAAGLDLADEQFRVVMTCEK